MTTSSPKPLRHVAIIPDGNRRWAKERNLPSLVGHEKGLGRFRELCQLALDNNLEAVSFWGFSTENWKRTEEEVGYLMKIFERLISTDGKDLISKGARLRMSGRISDLPTSLQKIIKSLVEESKENKGTVINICLSYGGRDELLRAVKKIVNSNNNSSDITEETINQSLDTAGLPDLDLIIRTSGEQRLSGFMPWQSTYAELFFSPLYFPDFSKQEFQKVIDWYVDRDRRFGK